MATWPTAIFLGYFTRFVIIALDLDVCDITFFGIPSRSFRAASPRWPFVAGPWCRAIFDCGIASLLFTASG